MPIIDCHLSDQPDREHGNPLKPDRERGNPLKPDRTRDDVGKKNSADAIVAGFRRISPPGRDRFP